MHSLPCATQLPTNVLSYHRGASVSQFIQIDSMGCVYQPMESRHTLWLALVRPPVKVQAGLCLATVQGWRHQGPGTAPCSRV